jgi:RNA polymerase sigma-70 factor (ECF subfamily)
VTNEIQSSTDPGKGDETPNPVPQKYSNFDEFFLAEYRLVVGLLLSLGAQLDQAKDAAQEAMIEIAQRWASIEYPKSYVRIVARRSFYRMNADDIRARSPQGGSRIELDDDLVVNTAALHDWVQTITELDSILNAIATLPPKQREVVALSLSGLSPQEIAAELDANDSTVRSNLRHGLTAIKAHLTRLAENAASTGRQR